MNQNSHIRLHMIKLNIMAVFILGIKLRNILKKRENIGVIFALHEVAIYKNDQSGEDSVVLLSNELILPN